jgi:alpha-beta hydrolase superfamily lysophospholipase
MKHPLSQSASLALGGLLVVSVAVSTTSAQAPTSVISSHTTEVDGLKLHYLTAGHGAAVILLHGYAETSRMWKPIMPRLSERFTVIAPDLPGIGDSAIPADGLDMKTAAIRMHALVTYSAPGLMGAGWAYFVSFTQAATDFAQLAQTKLSMPVLAIAGEKSMGGVLGQRRPT